MLIIYQLGSLIFLLIVTIVTETNGVSFSLVAGACCIVNFSNGLSAYVGANTININSTGAKTLKDEKKGLYAAGNPALLWYTGSRYRYTGLDTYYSDTD